MVDLLYVRRARRKRIAAMVSIGTTIALVAYGIIAFLGRRVGTFSITLQKSDVSIAICDESSFQKPSSYLRVPELPNITLWTYRSLVETGDDKLDNEENSWIAYGASKNDKGEIIGLNYFKYTFFVKNVGTIMAAYDIQVTISDITNPKNGANHALDDILRVMVYENDGYDASEHSNKRVFAKTSRQVNYLDEEETQITHQEYIAGDTHDVRNNFGFAEEFESIDKTSGIIMKNHVGGFNMNDMIRYTIVYWLEGEDPECSNVAPEGCSIKIGVNIKAYEN